MHDADAPAGTFATTMDRAPETVLVAMLAVAYPITTGTA
jgi:hypothetical protein